MSSGFRGVDFDQLAATYNAFAPDRYRIDGELVRLNTVDSPLFDWGASLVADGGRGFVACKRSAGGRLYKGPDKDQAHLTLLAFDDARTGVDLLTEVKTILRDRGVTRLVFG